MPTATGSAYPTYPRSASDGIGGTSSKVNWWTANSADPAAQVRQPTESHHQAVRPPAGPREQRRHHEHQVADDRLDPGTAEVAEQPEQEENAECRRRQGRARTRASSPLPRVARRTRPRPILLMSGADQKHHVFDADLSELPQACRFSGKTLLTEFVALR